MTTLSHAAAASDLTINVTPALATALPYPIALTLESEKLLIRGGNGTGTLYVERGQDGTTAAVHALGAAISLGWASGGGSGVTVDNGTDPPAAVTTLVAPGAVITNGSATLALGLQLLRTTISFTDTELFDTVQDGTGGKVIFALHDGQLFVDTWVTVVTLFNQAGGHNQLYLHRSIVAGDAGFFDYTNNPLIAPGPQLDDPGNILSDSGAPWTRQTGNQSDPPSQLIASKSWTGQGGDNGKLGNPVPFSVTGDLNIMGWIPLNPGNPLPTAGEAEIFAVIATSAS